MADDWIYYVVAAIIAYVWILPRWENRKWQGGWPLGQIELLVRTPEDPLSPSKKLYGKFGYAHNMMDLSTVLQLEKSLGVEGLKEVYEMVTRRVRGLHCENCDKWVDSEKYPLPKVYKPEEKCVCPLPITKLVDEHYRAYYIEAGAPTDIRYCGLNFVISTRALENPQYHSALNPRSRFGFRERAIEVIARGSVSTQRVRAATNQTFVVWVIRPGRPEKGLDTYPGETVPSVQAAESMVLLRTAANNRMEIEEHDREAKMYKTQVGQSTDRSIEVNSESMRLKEFLTRPQAAYPAGLEEPIRHGVGLTRLQKRIILGAVIGLVIAHFAAPTYAPQYDFYQIRGIGLVVGAVLMFIYGKWQGV